MNNSKQAILITGGAGYIGSHTITELLETTNYEVISVDNFSNSSPSVYDRINKITGKNIISYTVDINNIQDLEQVFSAHKNIVGIIHFAAYKAVHESVEDPIRYYRNNLVSLINILDCSKRFGVKNIIFSSSCTVYGNIKTLPVTENTEVNAAESPYGATKIMGEEILRDFIKSSASHKGISLRYFNPVGAHKSGLIGEDPRNKPNNLVPIITQFVSGLLPDMFVYGNDYPTKDGTCIRDYIHVSDIATAHIKALNFLLQKESAIYEVFNLGSGTGCSVMEVIQSFEKVSNTKVNYKIGARRNGDVVAIYSNSSKAQSILGWKAEYNLDDMMLSAWKWQQNNNKEKKVIS
ncbi:MAG: UDP-glucose 4-epimerase GalE [Bacteroidetes bacterium]|nr:UDP-glucose 4-epimerase GalE [Bacteroidota bacterium]